VFIFLACSSKDIKTIKEAQNIQKDEVPKIEFITVDKNTTLEVVEPEVVQDLLNIPQNIDTFLVNLKEKNTLYPIQTKYEKYYFSVWNQDKPKDSLSDILWAFNTFTFGKSYGENLQLLDRKFFDDMLENSNFKNYAKLNLKAITLKELNIRAFPTCRPVFMNPQKAGEGFPFDYMQNSTVHANKPMLISHYSKDKEWAYVFTSFTSGWVKNSDLVLLNKHHTDTWQKAKQVRIIKENIPIYDNANNFMFKSKIGMMFALVGEDKNTYTILTVSKFKNKKPLFIKSKISKNIASKEVLKLNKKNFKIIIDEVQQTNYGWGGIYAQRDCSSMIRDLYAPFGIWLPRNSSQQAKVGKVISLENKTIKEKIKFIKENALAFKTLLYKKGHILLYLGIYKNEIIVFQNVWGVKTKNNGVEGRFIIGKPVFSTLNLGKDLKYYDKNSTILKNLKSMNIITR